MSYDSGAINPYLNVPTDAFASEVAAVTDPSTETASNSASNMRALTEPLIYAATSQNQPQESSNPDKYALAGTVGSALLVAIIWPAVNFNPASLITCLSIVSFTLIGACAKYVGSSPVDDNQRRSEQNPPSPPRPPNIELDNEHGSRVTSH